MVDNSVHTLTGNPITGERTPRERDTVNMGAVTVVLCKFVHMKLSDR